MNKPIDTYPARTARSLAGRLASAADFLDRRDHLLTILLTLFVFLSGLGAAAHKLFTYDEQITWRTARMTVHNLLQFFSSGLDTTGPVPALLAHAGLRLPQSPEITLRLPFVLAFALMCFGLWLFLRGRYPAGFALTAIVIPIEFGVLSFFRTDARAYALMLCATGLGMSFWQMAAEKQRRPWSVFALWAVLALGISAHLFTVFLFVPFAAAQYVADREAGRMDWPVWSALVLFPLGWLPFMPGEMRAHRLYAATFWSKATLANLSDAYEQSITPNWTILFVLGIFLIGLALAMHFRKERECIDASSSGFRRAEWVLVLGLLVLPTIAWCGAHAIGAFHHYYTAPFMCGLVVAIVAAAAELARRQRAIGLVFFIMMTGLVLADGNLMDAWNGIIALADHGQVHRNNQASFSSADWVQWLNASPLPVAAENAVYAKLNLYGPPSLAARSYALTDFAGSNDHPLAMTDQNNMRLFGNRLGFQSEDIAAFMHAHSCFDLVQQRLPYTYEWLIDYVLRHRQPSGEPYIDLRFASSDGTIYIFQVCSTPSH